MRGSCWAWGDTERRESASLGSRVNGSHGSQLQSRQSTANGAPPRGACGPRCGYRSSSASRRGRSKEGYGRPRAPQRICPIAAPRGETFRCSSVAVLCDLRISVSLCSAVLRGTPCTPCLRGLTFPRRSPPFSPAVLRRSPPFPAVPRRSPPVSAVLRRSPPFSAVLRRRSPPLSPTGSTSQASAAGPGTARGGRTGTSRPPRRCHR